MQRWKDSRLGVLVVLDDELGFDYTPLLDVYSSRSEVSLASHYTPKAPRAVGSSFLGQYSFCARP